jgi:hypothetical protein
VEEKLQGMSDIFAQFSGHGTDVSAYDLTSSQNQLKSIFNSIN